jgi:16S rRNA (uracil1498-N3)-methyltransferase
MIRLFVKDALEAGTALEPSPEQARYLTSVMRKGPGDELLLFNGRDGEWRARIADVSKRGCRLALVERTRPQAFGPDLELVVALVKRARLETIVEKAAELGALRVQLVTTRYTNAERTNVDRLHLIAAEAAEQTGRLDVPEVRAPVALDRLLDAWPGDRALVFCDEGGEARPMLEALAGPAGQASILIGPEGGFAPEERARLRELPFVTPVSLGPRILRADTAAISAMSLWQAAAGDWRDRLPHPI